MPSRARIGSDLVQTINADTSAPANTINISANGQISVNNNILPAANVTYDLGTSALRWRDLYLSGSTIKLGNTTISTSGNTLQLPAGTKLGGATISTGGGSSVSYDDATANFTGTLQNGGSNVVVDTDIGSTVQAYDSNLTSFVSTFTLPTSDGTADQVLKTNGSGTLSFTDASGGGSGGGGTLGTLTKTFTTGEQSTISLTANVLAPLVSAIKEVVQTGFTNNSWDVNSTDENYTRVNSAYATTLTPSATSDGTFTLGTGSFAAGDVGKTIIGNGGVAVLSSTAGAYVSVTAFTDTSAIASGSWEMYAVVYNTTDGDLELSSTAAAGGFDVSTATYSQNFSVSAQETAPEDIAFNTDGTKMFIVGQVGQYVNEYTLSTAFDVSTASYSQNFSVSTEETFPEGIEFNNDGTKMFIVGRTGDDVNEYTLSTGFDVSTATYSQNFSVSAQELSPTGIAFNTNGTKMFIVGFDGDDVNEYTLSTGFDVSTASYSQNFSVSTEETSPQGIAFNTDGTKMFIVGITGDDVNEYTLVTIATPSGYHAVHTTTSTDSTYWTDINSMTADEAAGDGSIYYAVSTDDRTTWKVAHNTDGIRSIVRNNSGTWQYNSNGTYASETWTAASTNTELSALEEAVETALVPNPFDVSAASYSQNFSVSTEDTSPQSIAFNTSGTKMFIVGITGQDINEYTLSTAFDVSTASFVDSFSVSSQEATPTGIAFNTNGTKMFIVGAGGDEVNEYTLSTGFDVSTASYSQNFSLSTQETEPQGIAFNTDGTKMFVVGSVGDDVNEYTLSTGFDVSTASYSQNFSVSSQDTFPVDLSFNTDGTKMFIVGGTGVDINEYTLSTGFDVSTASFVDSFSVSSQEATPRGIAFNNDGTKMFIVGNTDDEVNEYTVGSASAYPNRMNKTQLEAVTDANHFTLGNDLDLAIIFNLSSGTTVPSSNGVSINYDGNVLNKGAILGTDYDFDAPAQNKVRVTALQSGNYKVRVL